MVAFLLANPDAFIDGNINRLKNGTTLQIPSPDLLASIDPQLARTLVALQAFEWHDGADDARRQEIASILVEMQAGLSRSQRHSAPIETVPARMKILPMADALASATSDPSMQTQLLPALREETLASRDAEIRHLQQKLAELEQKNGEQRALIAMQDEVLAQAQHQLQPSDGIPGQIRAPWVWLVIVIISCASIVALRWHRLQRIRLGKPAFH